jgi:hypothetical protein
LTEKINRAREQHNLFTKDWSKEPSIVIEDDSQSGWAWAGHICSFWLASVLIAVD